MKLTWVVSSVLIAVFVFSTLALVPTPSIAQQQLPDLMVPDAWQADSQICYSIKNIGTASVGGAGAPVSYYSALFIDGQQVAVDQVNVSLVPGKQLDSCFKYQWQATPGQHTIRVCADWGQNITESNEGNNCWNDMWVIEEEFPDLIIIDVWGYGGIPGVYTEIRYMIKNTGDGSAGPSTTVLYIDGVKVGEHRADELRPTEQRAERYLFEGECSGTSDEFTAIADFDNTVNESDETNNKYSRTYSCPSEINKPNLEVSAVWHEGEEEYYHTCRQYTEENNIRFRVKSSGDATSPTTDARLYVDGTWFSTRSIPPLARGEQYEGGFNYIGSCSGDYDTIRVVVDSNNDITELCERDNELTEEWDCFVVPPSEEKPDLVIQRIWLEPLGDGNYKIGYEIKNQGPGYAPYSSTGLYVDDVFKVEDGADSLAPGEEREEEFWWPYAMSACTPPSDTIRIVADYEDEIEEISETNNEYSHTWECMEIPTPPIEKPDLVIMAVWYESGAGLPYEDLSVSYSIQNQGTAPAGPSVTHVRINYNLLGTSDVPALDPGEVLGMVTFSETWTPKWNDAHVQICADVNNEVNEITPAPSGELNNCLEEDWTFRLSCLDGVQNRDEEGIDCGGSYCPPCNRCDLAILPSHFDWRDYYTLPPIRNQSWPQRCESCWAHAAIGAIEGTYIVQTRGNPYVTPVNLSEQYAICEVRGDCSGGCPHDVLKYARDHGIVDENCQTYLASNSPCNKCGDWRDRLWKISGYGRVSSNIEDIKRTLICCGPLSVGSENWEHAVVIVGYDDSAALPQYDDGTVVGYYSPGCWTIRNSWGLNYGDDLDGDGFYDDPGYGLVPYSGHSHSDIKKYVHCVGGVTPP